MTIGDIVDLNTYKSYSIQFFEYYELTSFTSENLSHFNKRLIELKSFYDEDNNVAYAQAAALLAIGYNTLFQSESFFKTQVVTSIFDNIWSPSNLNKSYDVIQKIKNYLLFSNKNLDFETFNNEYKAVVGSEYTTKKGKTNFQLPPDEKVASARAAFDASVYFYRDFSKFLSPEERLIISNSDNIPQADKELKTSLENLQEAFGQQNKISLYALLGISALTILLSLGRR